MLKGLSEVAKIPQGKWQQMPVRTWGVVACTLPAGIGIQAATTEVGIETPPKPKARTSIPKQRDQSQPTIKRPECSYFSNTIQSRRVTEAAKVPMSG